MSSDTINYPENILNLKEVKKYKPEIRATYYQNVIFELFWLNKGKSFNQKDISKLLNISLPTVDKYVIQLLGSRKIYSISNGGLNSYKLNGRISHLISSGTFRLGTKEFEISVLMNEVLPTFLISEIEFIAPGKRKVAGAIEIEGNYLDEFIDNLNDLRLILKSEANKLVSEEVFLK